MPNDQRLRNEIKGDLRLVCHRAAVGRIILDLQKTGLARQECCPQEITCKSRPAERPGIRRGRQILLRLGLLWWELKLEMAPIVGQRGVLLVGGVDEGARSESTRLNSS